MVDVEAVRGLARRVGALAQDTRATAGRARDTSRVDWQSVAAERWRSELEAEARRVDVAAEALDDAVRALHDHAEEVERRLTRIAAAQQAFGDALDRARRVVAEAADDAQDAATEGARRVLAAAGRVPAPGSPDWLDVGRLW